MAVLHKLQTGLDVNVKFTDVRVFEYTPECIVFDLLDIPLYHGWLVDPQVCMWALISESYSTVVICSVSQIHYMQCISSFSKKKKKKDCQSINNYIKIINYKMAKMI